MSHRKTEHRPTEGAGFRGRVARWVRLLRSWWQADRVRISPREGRLLRLEPPCIVRIGGRYAQVLHRRTGQTPEGPYVCYECEVDDQPAQLWVEPVGQAYMQRVRWSLAGVDASLLAEEVEVFG